MTTVICGYKECSYNIEGICKKSFIGINTKKYGLIQCLCSGYTTEEIELADT